MDDLQHELDAVEKRTRRYWFQDGVVEMSSGAVFLVVAIYLLIQNAWRDTLPHTVFNIAFPVLIVVLVFAGRWMVRTVKDRYVHPRTGYVSFRRREGHRWARGALAFVIAALTTLVISRSPVLLNWIPALEGLVFAVAFFALGRNVDILRFPVEGLLCALVGVALAVSRLQEDVAAALLFAWLGVVLVAGGLGAFIGYTRQLPPSEQE